MNSTLRNSRRATAVLLSGLLLTASCIGWSNPAAAQFAGPPPPPPSPGPESGPSTGGGGNAIGRDIGEGVAIGVGVGILWILLQRVITPPPPPAPSAGPPPPDTLADQPPGGPESSNSQPSGPRQPNRHAGNNGGHGTPRDLPPFIPDEVIVEFSSSASSQSIDQIARRHRLTQLESQSLPLIGATLYRLHILGGRSVQGVVGSLRNEQIVTRAQPNYVFALQEEALKTSADAQGDASQYVLDKLQIKQAHQIATGKGVLVAVIDSEIDAKHPDLDGTITKSFDALGSEETPDQHGTAMAGAIAAHGKLLGIAPDAEILAEHAFDASPGTAKGTSFSIYKSLQWAADNGARVVNMSFAGPADPTLHRLLAAANEKDMVLIAAAGNAGPNSPPLYPAADPNVIAVTATDSNNDVYKMANRGPYIAVAAPGVEILALAPDESYLITTGTSVAAAHVSGIAALLLERKASLKPKDIRTILVTSAAPLGSSARRSTSGAGLVDAYRALLLAGGKSAARDDDEQAKQ
jgi:subtilisin family serine protease